MNEPEDLVYIADYGLLGSNFYWHKYATHGLSKEDILNAGLTDDRVRVSQAIMDSLVQIDAELKQKGMRLYIKEGYRSPALYEIVYKRRSEKYGQEITDRLFNVVDKPHAQGKSVDVALWDAEKNQEIFLRRREDGVEALFFGFYKDTSDAESKKYHELQLYLTDLMTRRGFRFGGKGEYFHFNHELYQKPI